MKLGSRIFRWSSGCRAHFRRLPHCAAALVSAVGLVAAAGPSQIASKVDGAEAASAERQVDFAREIQPILARRCFACHGPNNAEGGLRLNNHDAALAELDSGAHAIVPGKIDASALLRRVMSDDDDERMPPKDKRLAPEQVDLLRQWISQGAPWGSGWALEPARPQSPPAVKNEAWVRNDIDRFILGRLEQAGIAPPPPAARAALLRRAYYDLTGLPPTPAELDAFLADASPQAYARVIDQLLESPRYGERWARHWLDVVRYADTNSFERDGVKPHAWRYRDYVIRSLNADKPYDQFLREQLAGDELPAVTADTIVATGFYRLGLWDDEPADRAQARYEELDDILTTTSQAVLGLTINCARCHDHKIDPLTQRDYYQMLAFFQGIRGMANDGPSVETQIFNVAAGRDELSDEARQIERQYNEAQGEINKLGEALLNKYKQTAPPDAPAEIYIADLEDLEYRFYRDTFDRLPKFDELKPESTGKLPGFLIDLSPATRETAFGFVFTAALIVPREGDYRFYLDSDDGSRLLVDGSVVIEHDGVHKLGDKHEAVVHLRAGRLPLRLEYFQRNEDFGLQLYWGGFFGHRALFKTGNPLERRPVSLDELFKTEGVRLVGEEPTRHYQHLRKKLDDLKAKKLPSEFALSVSEVGPQAPDTFVLGRGSVHAPGEKVEPGFPGVLSSRRPGLAPAPPGSKSSRRRIVLAEWLASADNPLTARVMANRIWQQHFGRGIVRTPNNFGGLGTPPTHPELLDWLAQQFVAGGWQLKPVHRLIMLSAAYQMSAQTSDDAGRLDPANDLFSRFDMRRISAEELRDSILAVDGRLNLKMYGPGVFTEISAEVMAGQSQPGLGWGKSVPAEQARRSIYVHVKRSLITPILSSFDFPDTDSSCEARFVTTPPTQALALLNGKFLHDEAAAFADRLAREAGADPRSRIALAIKLAFCRSAGDAEIDRGVKLIETLGSKHALAPEQAWKYYCLALLNQNEFVYLD
jgi:mono/diheme cytochrome c family protein